jgi:hypothetical protein
MELVNENVVVTAHAFNLSIVTQLWLIKNCIVKEEEWQQAGLFTPAFIQFSTNRFDFTLMPERLQLAPHATADEAQATVREVVGGFVKTLPHTPFTGVGLNFNCRISESAFDVHTVGKRLFFRTDSPLASEFGSDDARYGAYFSKDWLGMRLKLTCLPVQVRSDLGIKEVLQFAFNFHKESMDSSELTSCLENWSNAREFALSLVNSVEKML